MTSPPPEPYPLPLSDEHMIYRAIRRGWYDRDTRELSIDAFIRRVNDKKGLSVDTVSAEGAKSTLQRAYAASLQVRRVREPELKLDVVPDSETHANIQWTPSYEESTGSPEMEAKAKYLAGKLKERVVEMFF